MNGKIVINDRLSICREELSVSHSKAGGPGGQNVNKVNTKVSLRWRLSENLSLSENMQSKILKSCATYLVGENELLIQSTRYRSQKQNLQDCIDKLKNVLCKALQPEKRRIRTKRSAGSNERRLRAKKQSSQKKKLRKKVREDRSI